MHEVRVCPVGVGATSAAVFVLNYRLRQFPLSTVTNRFELRCQLKQLLLYIAKSFLVSTILKLP